MILPVLIPWSLFTGFFSYATTTVCLYHVRYLIALVYLFLWLNTVCILYLIVLVYLFRNSILLIYFTLFQVSYHLSILGQFYYFSWCFGLRRIRYFSHFHSFFYLLRVIGSALECTVMDCLRNIEKHHVPVPVPYFSFTLKSENSGCWEWKRVLRAAGERGEKRQTRSPWGKEQLFLFPPYNINESNQDQGLVFEGGISKILSISAFKIES